MAPSTTMLLTNVFLIVSGKPHSSCTALHRQLLFSDELTTGETENIIALRLTFLHHAVLNDTHIIVFLNSSRRPSERFQCGDATASLYHTTMWETWLLHEPTLAQAMFVVALCKHCSRTRPVWVTHDHDGC